jgi:hypothetical protein
MKEIGITQGGCRTAYFYFDTLLIEPFVDLGEDCDGHQFMGFGLSRSFIMA